MEKVRINNDVEFYYNVYRNGVPESFIGASEISVKLVNEAYTEEIPITYSITGNVLTCNALAENLTKCGVCRLFLSYTKADTFTTDAVPFQLVGLREDTTVEVGEPIIVSGDIGVNKDGASAYEVWESYPGNEGKTIEQYFEWLRENPTKIDLDGLNSNIEKLHFKPDTLVQLSNIGDVRYSTESKTLEVKVSDTVSIQLGQEMQTRVKNDESIQINNGQMVYINSAVGANPLAKIASTSNPDVAQRTFGMATENIPANRFGAITTEGLVRDINTSAFTEGEMLWLGTNGNVTNIEPTAPTSKISVGMVLRSNANNGIVYVKIRAIARNQKLSDVYAPTLTGGDVLRWNSTTLRFEAFNITSALSNKVDTSRTITAGNGLTGGGALSGDVTVNVGNTDDSIAVGTDGIKVDTQNSLTSTSTTKPLSAAQGKALQDNKAEKTRTITAGNGLTGGGDLTADRTINIANADDSLVVTADNIKVNTNNTLTSTSATQPLSANQGKVLNEKVVQVETDLNELFNPYPMTQAIQYWPNGFYGFCSIVNGVNCTITGFKVQKYGNNTATLPINISLWKSPTNVISDKISIESFTLDPSTYNSHYNGENFTFNLNTPYNLSVNEYLIISVECLEYVVFGQVNRNNYQFINKGMYQNSIGGPWFNAASGESLYFEISTLDKFIQDRYLSFNINEIEEKVSHSSDISLLEYRINGLVTQNNISVKNDILLSEKDLYVTLHGDSIAAWQSTMAKAFEGVTDCPPVCDRLGFANRLFNAIKFGSPIYQRFDKGKYSLVGNWDSSLVDDSTKKFTEVGTFGTRYVKGSGSVADNLTRPQYTTLITGDFAADFDKAGYQRNIPKRFSNSENASVQFTIPAGYSKFDFIYHAHTLGDVLTVTVNRGAGIVKMNTKQNDWDNSIEANSGTFTTIKPTQTGGRNDDYGIPNMRQHFKISDTSVDTVITISKSSDISKYLIYWGICYWGTAYQPYALHLNVMARGGAGIGTLQAYRDSDIRFSYPDLIIFELPCINDLRNAGNNESIRGSSKYWIGFLNDYINSLNIKVAYVIPHLTTTMIDNGHLESSGEYYSFINGYVRSIGGQIAGDVHLLMYKVWNYYYKDNMTYRDFIKSLMADNTTHPNEDGFLFYKIISEKIIY